MNSKEADKYAFLWSQARLLIAAVALFMGGIPPVLALNPISGLSGIINSLLTLAWVISGLVSGYLLYRWWGNKQKIFGEKDTKDTIAFLINIITGFNLGYAGLMNVNIGMTFSTNYMLFILTGIIYLITFIHLFKRWNESGEKLF